MRTVYLYAVLVLAFSFFSGCATMFSGSSQELEFRTKPSEAEVTLSGKSCETPCDISVKKGSVDKQAFVTKEGYEQQTVTLAASVDAITYANFFNLGFGYLVDYITGAYMEYDGSYTIPLTEK